MSLRAVDNQGFAGGFTLGVVQAGFELAGKRELPGGFGVPSVEANRHLVPGEWETEVGPAEGWSVPRDVALVFGNPPCSAFSMLGKRKMADDPVSSCMTAFVDYAARVRPIFAAFESVQQAYRDGLGLMRQLHARLEERTGDEWALHHVFHDGGLLGGPSRRPRYFWVAARAHHPLALRLPEGAAYPALRDVLIDLEGLDTSTPDDQPYQREPTWWSAPLRRADGLVDGHQVAQNNSDVRHTGNLFAALRELGMTWTPGSKMSHHFLEAWQRAGERAEELLADAAPPRFPAAARRGESVPPGYFEVCRWDYDKPGKVTPGTATRRIAHPGEERTLTLREVYRLQGFPDDWRVGALMRAYGIGSHAWPGKGIPVPAGRWLATAIRAALEDPAATTRDAREAPGPERTGEREWRWLLDGRSRAPEAASGPLPTKLARDNPGPGDGLVEALRAGPVTLTPPTENPKDVKATRERVYAAAYKLGRRARTWVDEGGIVHGELKDQAAPRSRQPAASGNGKVTHDYQVGQRARDPEGREFEFDGRVWRLVRATADGTVRASA